MTVDRAVGADCPASDTRYRTLWQVRRALALCITQMGDGALTTYRDKFILRLR
ncbi:MAG: hypothetical protein QOE32_4232 [Pseudonocardiales bacterium]|jgi:hypothetical protein|nr:hypothetical protein [Pseudonocardiales bacterium]